MIQAAQMGPIGPFLIYGVLGMDHCISGGSSTAGAQQLTISRVLEFSGVVHFASRGTLLVAPLCEAVRPFAVSSPGFPGGAWFGESSPAESDENDGCWGAL